MKIRVECPCGEILSVKLNENFEVIYVESLDEDTVEISSEESKEILNNLGYEFG